MPDPDRTSSRSIWPRWLLLPRLRHSLVWLLIAVTAAAIVLGFASTFRDFVSSLLFVSVCCVLPTPFVTAAIFGRGDLQSFAIGALVPWLTLLPWMSTMALWLVILPIICGTLAVITRRWLRLFGGV
jgi:hypothetical protein